MHIGIDALFRLQQGGGRIHLQRLLNAWRDSSDRISVFTTPDGFCALKEVAGENVQFHVFRIPGWHFAARLLWEQIVFPNIVNRAKLDVLFCPGNLIPFRAQMPTVVLLQNAMPYCPEVTRLNFRSYIRYQLIGRLMERSIARADCSIFVSEDLRRALLNRVKVDLSQTAVINYGLDLQPASALPSSATFPFPYLLYVSAIWPYKHMGEVIEGYAGLLVEHPDCEWRLVIVGRVYDERYFADLKLLLAKLALIDKVIFTGGIDHERVKTLLANAVGFVYASTCESFGIPLLEAMTAGVPMACGQTPIVEEVVGEAALLFNPTNPPTITIALSGLLDPVQRRLLSERGLARAATFATWEQAASRTREIFGHILHKQADTQTI